jgi:hypothetical protein
MTRRQSLKATRIALWEEKRKKRKKQARKEARKEERAAATPAKRLYRRKTAAAILDCDISMLKRLEKEGLLHPKRLGLRHVFYAAEEIEAIARGE